MAQIYFSLYLSAASNMKVEKALEYNEKNMELNILIHGEDSIEVSNNHYCKGTLTMKSGDLEKALTHITKAIDSFNNFEKSPAFDT
jgi:hypothetical protein